MRVMGSRRRRYRNAAGEQLELQIRRLRCPCRRIHHELPDLLVPYKRYAADCVERALAEPANKVAVAADESTLRRWRRWVENSSAYWQGCRESIGLRFGHEAVQGWPDLAQTAHPRGGHGWREGVGWLRHLVRSVVNANLWRQTRWAFLSAPAFDRLIAVEGR